MDLAIQILDGTTLRPGGKIPMSVTHAKFEQKGSHCLCLNISCESLLCLLSAHIVYINNLVIYWASCCLMMLSSNLQEKHL